MVTMSYSLLPLFSRPLAMGDVPPPFRVDSSCTTLLRWNRDLSIVDLCHQVQYYSLHTGVISTTRETESRPAEKMLIIKQAKKRRQRGQEKKENMRERSSAPKFSITSANKEDSVKSTLPCRPHLPQSSKSNSSYVLPNKEVNHRPTHISMLKIFPPETMSASESILEVKNITSVPSSSPQSALGLSPLSNTLSTTTEERLGKSYISNSSLSPPSEDLSSDSSLAVTPAIAVQHGFRSTAKNVPTPPRGCKKEINAKERTESLLLGSEVRISTLSENPLPVLPPNHSLLSVEGDRTQSTPTLCSTRPMATASPLPTSTEKSPYSSSLTVSPSSHRQAYVDLLCQTYINPFNGKRLHVDSANAKLLSSLGFVRREDNPLFVRWMPEIYMQTVERERQKIEEKMLRKYKQQLKRYEKEKEQRQRQRKREKERKSRIKNRHVMDDKDSPEGEDRLSPPMPPSPPSIQEGVDSVLRPLEKKKKVSGNSEEKGESMWPGDRQNWMDVLLRSSESELGSSDVLSVATALSSCTSTTTSSSWMLELSVLLRRPDALTVIPCFLEQRYLDLTTSSVMPPKLDTSGTDFSMPLPLSGETEKTEKDGKLREPSHTESSVSDEKKEVQDIGSKVMGSGGESEQQHEEIENMSRSSASTTLTVDQLNVLNLAQQGYSLFIGGSAGTGKTVLLRQIHKQLTQMGLRVAMTATTGVAAVQLGGCTFHHAFNAPIYAGGGAVDSWGIGGAGMGISAELWNRRWDQTVLRAVDVVMVDEVSLLDAQTFDAFDMEARLARMSSQPFGGIQVLICGDFLQLSIGLQDALPAYLSTAFGYLMKVRLETPMRHRVGDPLLPLLNKVRRGEYDGKLFAPLDKPIPQDANGATDEGKGSGVNSITFIFPRRRDAQKLNDAKLSELITMEKLFPPQRGPLRLTGEFTSSAFIEMLNGSSVPPRGKVLDLIRGELTVLLRERLQELTCGTKSNADNSEFDACIIHEGTQTPQIFSASSAPASFSKGGGGVGYLAALMSALSLGNSVSALLPDLDVVLMPAQTNVSLYSASSCTATSSFFLRVRYPNRTPGMAFNGGAASAIPSDPVPTNSSISNTRSNAESSADEHDSRFQKSGNKLMGEKGLLSAGSTSTITRRRAGLLQMLLTNEMWERLANAVANRLSARVVSFFEDEPRSMVPLSVSMALADLTNNDIAQTLTPLRLKLGCRVMVNRNLSRRVSNGSVGTVEAFADPDPSLFPSRYGGQVGFSYRSPGADVAKAIEAECFDQLPIVRLLDGNVVQIPPIPIHIGGTPVTYYYGHDVFAVPLQLGYAFTVHKVQGLTLQGTVVLDCKNFFDCPHLVYVACSRVTSIDQLIVKNIKPGMVMVKESALEFSDTLTPASNAEALIPPPEIARGSWAIQALSPVMDIPTTTLHC